MTNPSVAYGRGDQVDTACAVICVRCARIGRDGGLYGGNPVHFGEVTVFIRGERPNSGKELDGAPAPRAALLGA